MERTCVVIYGPEAGRNIEDLIQRATGQPCPCRRQQRCPLLDEHDFNSLLLAIPVQRDGAAGLRHDPAHPAG